VTTRRPPKKSLARVAGPVGVSWVALLAATTLGVGGVQRLRAAVSADPRELGDAADSYRLIVQSYAPSSLGTGQLPGGRARPLASTQREITPAELARGVSVDMLGLDKTGVSTSEAPVIVAWIERGRADLAFDGFEARPAVDGFYGIATTGSAESPSSATPIVLKRRVSG
jgi:hypothetical protein